MVSIERLKELIEYRNGRLLWKVNRGSAKIGDAVGSPDKDGYIKVRIDGKMYRAGRLTWFYHHGIWPENLIDHINGIRNDDSIENLREATYQENMFNRKSCGKYSPYKGVSWHKRDKKWQASYQLNGRRIFIGSYNTEQEAREAYQKVTKSLHKEFYRDS